MLVDYDSGSEEESQPLAASFASKLPKPTKSTGPRKIIVQLKNNQESMYNAPPAKRQKLDSSTDLSALLPAPRRSKLPSMRSSTQSEAKDISREVTDEKGIQGVSIMEKEPDDVVLSGRNTVFKPNSLRSKKPMIHTPTLAKKDLTKPKVSLFSVSSIATYKEPPKASASDTYDPILATEARLQVHNDRDSKSSGEQAITVHPSELYRYDAEHSHAHTAEVADEEICLSDQTDPAMQAFYGRRIGKSASGFPVEMREYNVNEKYEENQAYIESGKQEAAPVRMVASGRHQLSSLLSFAQSQKDSLEASFARNQAARREGGSKYGF